jgi:hypothetical protein
MNKKFGVVALVVCAAMTLVLAGCSASAKSSRALKQVFISDCGVGESAKPKAITLACADAGMYVDGIKWSTWGGTSADGQGIFHMNQCEPSCVDGKFIDVPVTLSVSAPINVKKKIMYSQIALQSTNGKDLVMGEPTYATDLVTEGF